MQVVVITDERLKKELLAQTVAGELQLSLIGHIDEYPHDGSADACIDLLFDNSAERIRQLQDLDSRLTIVNAVTTAAVTSETNFIRVNGWPGFLRREMFEASGGAIAARDAATTLFRLLGRKTEWVPDICGFISARVVATIINEAFFALEEGISTASEIDTAMKSGTNYPFGPFEWAEMIGLRNIYTLLQELAVEEPRYIPCKLLEKKALA